MRSLLCVSLVLATPATAVAKPPTVRAAHEGRGTTFQRQPGRNLGLRAGGRLFVLQRRTDRSIAHTRGTIDGLGQRIATLEGENRRKDQEAASLRGEFKQREDQLRERQNGATAFAVGYGLLGFVTGGIGFAIGLGIGALAVNEKLRVDDLMERRHRLEGEHAEIRRQFQNHLQLRQAVEPELAALQDVETRLVQAIAAITEQQAGPPDDVAPARTRLQHSRELLGNLRGQVGILERIEASATRLGISLDLHLDRARRDLAYAERLLDRSTREYLRVVRLFLLQHPAAAVGSLVRDEVVSLAGSLLQQAGLGKEVAGVLAGSLIPSVEEAARFAAALEAQL